MYEEMNLSKQSEFIFIKSGSNAKLATKDYILPTPRNLEHLPAGLEFTTPAGVFGGGSRGLLGLAPFRCPSNDHAAHPRTKEGSERHGE